MKKVFIIAEAGVNHNGSVEIAKKLIDKAKDANVDAIKFQTFKSENVVSKNAEKAEYQKKNDKNSESQLEMIKKLELSFHDFEELKNYCKQKNILFLSTAFDNESIDFLNSLELPLFKIPSGEITNYPYLKKIAQIGKQVIMSTGMSTIEEIEQAVNVLETNGLERLQISLLHCNTEYPTPFEDVNLRAMQTLKEFFNVKIGYSDHTDGIEVSVAAVAMGAKIIEKHFTLNKNMEGPDHKASLEPDELKKMVESIRNIELALGNSKKQPSNSEIKNINIARKSIVAFRSIKKGENFTENNITTKRPGNGLSPMKWETILGKPAIRDFKTDEMIEI